MPELNGADIVCFSNDWDGDPLSKTHLMRLASRHNRVLWVNSLGNRAPRPTGRDLARIRRRLSQALQGLREVEPNIHVLSPIAVPLYGNPWAQELNRRLLEWQVRAAMRRLDMRRPIAMSFLPAAAPVFDRLEASLRVYYCVDEFSAFDGAGDAIARLERELLAKSDLVICSAEPLVRAKQRMHPRVHLVRHGVDLAHFSKATRTDTPVHPTVDGRARPVLAFVGLVAEWVDQDLLVELARHYRHGTLLVVGRADVDVSRLRTEPNVVLMGRRPYSELPSILRGVDVGLVAFKDNELTQAANPLKAREYLAAGLPVVSTPIPEVERLGVCRIARGAQGFIEAIDACLQEGAGPSVERSEQMQNESWESRWEQVARLLSEGRDGTDSVPLSA